MLCTLRVAGEQGECGDRRLDVAVHRHAALAQGGRRVRLGIGRVYDERASCVEGGGDERLGRRDLLVRELRGVDRVPAEVAGEQHRVDVSRGEQQAADVRVRGKAEPHFHVPRVRKLRSIPSCLALQVGAHHSCGRRNAVPSAG